jgi:hypothetical protein
VGIEPRACSSGSLTTWSSPTQSTQDGGCHQRLRGCRQGRAQAGDEQEETKRHGEVGGMGSLWCSLSFGSSIWVIVDRLTKSAHFIPVNTNYNVQKYTEIYVARVLCLHGVPKMIISNRGSQFIARFWEPLHASLGTHLIHSSAYHPQTDGQTERVNQILEDMLRACVMEYPGSWDKNLPWAEFSYNNSYQESLKMAPFEALYG